MSEVVPIKNNTQAGCPIPIVDLILRHALRPIRSLIEDVFKLAKNAFNMVNLHRYTMRSLKIIALWLYF